MFRIFSIILLFFSLMLTVERASAAEPAMAPVGVAVTLESFEVRADVNGVRVTWETVTEQNTSGFRIYRASRPNGSVTLLTSLIPTQAPNGGGAYYEFVDSSAEVGNTYYYFLDAVGTNGQTLRYGPAVIDLNPTAVTVGAMNVTMRETSWVWLAAAMAGIALFGIVRACRFRA